jgi:hypothetical protein
MSVCGNHHERACDSAQSLQRLQAGKGKLSYLIYHSLSLYATVMGALLLCNLGAIRASDTKLLRKQQVKSAKKGKHDGKA